VVGRLDVLRGEQLADESLSRDDAVCVHQQHCEQCSLLGAPDGERDTIHPNRERAEDPELKATLRHLRPRKVSSLRRLNTIAEDRLGTSLGHRSETLGACSERPEQLQSDEHSGLFASWPRFSPFCRSRVCPQELE
jgi:hypothetical protein